MTDRLHARVAPGVSEPLQGTSVAMIEAHYGALLDTAHGSLPERLDTFVT